MGKNLILKSGEFELIRLDKGQIWKEFDTIEIRRSHVFWRQDEPFFDLIMNHISLVLIKGGLVVKPNVLILEPNLRLIDMVLGQRIAFQICLEVYI